ncbi:hypothetical protein F2Q69_00034815 [Brassica cretica]|uniref:Uncharacterized protein n=1 Tax=Brassica cretica TaxID=69181 RepID=A0A8S9SR26_BRACR|nr:hypothetical protein F2Q69_00034815 [Brassica cretica]
MIPTNITRKYTSWIALSQLLGTDRSLAVTRHGSLSCGYSSRIALSQLLGLDSSLTVTRIARKSRA